MIDEETIAAAAAYVCDLFAGEASGHGVDHALRVSRTAADIARCEGADVCICRLAALLHDVVIVYFTFVILPMVMPAG